MNSLIRIGVVFLLPLFWRATGASEPHRHPWAAQLHRVHIQHQQLGTLAAPLLNYNFSLPPEQLRRATVFLGANARLRRVVKALISGEPVKVGVIGGSVSTGHGASIIGTTDWVSRLRTWLTQAFPRSSLRNGCIAGTPSAYMVVCLDMSVDDDVDVVFSEYALNDGYDPVFWDNDRVKEYERLVRRVLDKRNRPAMIFMQFPSHGVAFPPGDQELTHFHYGLEGVYGTLAQYYDTQWLSFKTAFYRLVHFVDQDKWRAQSVMDEDFIHPNDGGHKMMADLAVWLIQQTAMDLFMRPYGAADEALLQEPLPPPMVFGNTVPSSPMCVQLDALKELVVGAEGFEFIAEGPKKKKGYVGLKPGDWLKFRLDTLRPGSPRDAQVIVQLGHLRSYENMGVATMTCLSGCNCDPKEVDGHHTVRESQTYLARTQVSQSSDCVLQVTITNKTNSGLHKFKVTGIMISDSAGGGDRHGFLHDEEKFEAIDKLGDTPGSKVPGQTDEAA